MPAPAIRGPKFRRRAEARPDEVLDAALALFVERGFAATRVEDIAARAGLSKGAVYLYFPSKEAILEGLVKRAVVPIANNALGIFENYAGDPRPVITAALMVWRYCQIAHGFVRYAQASTTSSTPLSATR